VPVDFAENHINARTPSSPLPFRPFSPIREFRFMMEDTPQAAPIARDRKITSDTGRRRQTCRVADNRVCRYRSSTFKQLAKNEHLRREDILTPSRSSKTSVGRIAIPNRFRRQRTANSVGERARAIPNHAISLDRISCFVIGPG